MHWCIVLIAAAASACGDNVNAPDVNAPDADPPVPIPVFAQTAYIKSAQPVHDAHFGKSALSADGNTLVGAQPGSVTVYTHDGTWRVAGELAPSTASADFGSSVAISSDGSTIAVAAREDHYISNTIVGSVYVFHRGDTAWTQEARIDIGAPIAYDEFDAPLALSSDGNTLVAGSLNRATGMGEVRTYERNQNAWSQVASLGGGSNDYYFGLSLALAGDASVLAASVIPPGANDGAVELFERDGNMWLQRAVLTTPDHPPLAAFGRSISCSARCETLVIGDIEPQPFPSPSGPGMPGTGVAYVFARNGIAWTLSARLRANNADIGDQFGKSVAVSDDGSTIVVGAPSEFGLNNAVPYEGAVYGFRQHRGEWPQVMYIKASNAETVDIFGSFVGLSNDGTTIVVSALYESGGSSGVNGDQTDNSAPYAGAIYAFDVTY